MPRVDIVPAIGVFAIIAGQSHAAHDFDDTANEEGNGQPAVAGCFRHAIDFCARIGQHRHIHGDGTVIVMQADQQEQPPKYNAAEITTTASTIGNNLVLITDKLAAANEQ